MDPTRFTNRGGNLLKEEKQRSELHKNLPKVRHKDHVLFSKLRGSLHLTTHHFFVLSLKLEKKLKDQIEAWEGEQGREFLVNGQQFLQYVEEQWELHRLEKETEKQERVMTPFICPMFNRCFCRKMC